MNGLAEPDADPDAAAMPAIPLSPARAERELTRIALRAREETLAHAAQRIAAREAALEVLRFDSPAVRALFEEAGLVAAVRRWIGTAEGDALGEQIRRSRLFLPGWYRQRYLAGTGEDDPLAHFVATGLARGLQPNPFLDPDWYAAAHRLDVGTEPALLHYLRIGGPYALAPGPLFDPVAYLTRNLHLHRERDLLAHFLREGIDQGLLPEPVAV